MSRPNDEHDITCREAIDALLAAEPDELTGKGGTPLARHLAGCRRCREAAALVVSGTAALDDWLEGPSATAPADAIERALGAATAPDAVKRGRARWGLPLAAAALLATLLLLEDPGGPPPGEPYNPRNTAPGLALDVPAGRSAAVLETGNPEITVVWFYEGD